MNKIIKNYEELTVLRGELDVLIESGKDNPLKQLKNFSTQSSLRENIDELKKSILKSFREHFESTPNEAKSVEFLQRFKAIDDKSAALQASTRKMTASSGEASLNYLKGLTELQNTRNELLEEMVGTITEIQPMKTSTHKKKM